jgi:hypothetical protein
MKIYCLHKNKLMNNNVRTKFGGGGGKVKSKQRKNVNKKIEEQNLQDRNSLALL